MYIFYLLNQIVDKSDLCDFSLCPFEFSLEDDFRTRRLDRYFIGILVDEATIGSPLMIRVGCSFRWRQGSSGCSHT